MNQRALPLLPLALLLLGLVAAMVQPVTARSDGMLGVCDVTPQWYPTSLTAAGRQLWPNGRFGANYSSTKTPYLDSGYMRWVNAPTPSEKYTLRAGDGALSADAKVYRPDTPVELHLRVSDLRMRYIGLLLYASNNTGAMLNGAYVKENHVGDWQITPGDEFQIPTTCGAPTVSHTNANLKPLHARFLWQAPKGTGTVVFRILIKQGEQNKGSFYYPAIELRLTEAAPLAPPTQRTVIGEPGVACADVCYQQTPSTPYCNAAAMTALSTTAQLATALKGTVPVRAPLLAQCAYAGTPQITAAGYAAFRSSSVASFCPASYVAGADSTPQPDVCYTSPLQQARGICICSADSAVQTPNPYRFGGLEAEPQQPQPEPHTVTVEAGDEKPSAAAHSARASAGLLVLLAGALSLVSGKGAGRMAALSVLCVLALSSLAAPVEAHNYIKSVHRAWEAAVANPCQARIGNQPHVQVAANQEFEIEWSVGHGDYTRGPFYFAVIHESAYEMLRADNITEMLQDYVAKAPAGAALTGAMWEKHHLHNIDECSETWQGCNLANYFKETALPATDPSFIKRDKDYMAKAHPSQYTDASKVVQTRFLDTHIANDKRVSYVSSVYPWIEAVSIFENPFKEHATYFNQADIARFTVPARRGAGDYIVWFNWSGYMDCVDVNVVPGTTPVEKRYGQNATAAAPTLVKMDHCEYTYVGWTETGCYKLDPVKRDASKCIAECMNSPTCTAVQIVRANNADWTLPAVVNVPFVPLQWNATAFELAGFSWDKAGLLDPCMSLSVQLRVERGCKLKTGFWCDRDVIKPGPDDYICYGTNPQRNQDNQVEEDYRIATEKEDPVWYSTCLAKVPAGGFLNIPPFEYKVPTWDAGDACIDCAFHKNLSMVPNTATPDWTRAFADTCQDCSIKNSAATMAALPLAGANQPNAGLPPATSFSWVTGTAGACSCGGWQTRTVTCQSSAGTVVPDSSCTSTKPATSLSCAAPSSCFEWKVGSWSSCSNDCGSGTTTATVTCVQSATGVTPGATASSESLCSAASKPASSRTCNTVACPVQWKESGFGACTVACGGGTQTQTVSCVQTQNGQQSAVPDAQCSSAGTKPVSSRTCNTQACQDGTYAYGPWSSCSKECGGGVQTRTQSCVSSSGAAYADNSRCATATPQPTQQACNTGACPTYAWSSPAFGACSCSNTQTRAVSCVATPGGAVADSYCSAAGAKPATSQACASSGCYEWKLSAWTSCSVNCGGGTSTATATCVQSATGPSPGTAVAASFCSGAGLTQPATSRACNTVACPVQWKEGGFDACSVACGTGTQTQTVSCVQTQNGMSIAVPDAQCSSAGTKPVSSRTCNTQACQDGQYAYTQWSVCSASCGGGVQTRTQSCVDASGTVLPDNTRCQNQQPLPTQQTCGLDACPTYSWSAGTYSACSVGCGSGSQTRTVQCVSSAGGASVADSYCSAAGTKPVSSATCTMPDACYEWKVGAWTACSVDCGSGTQTAPVQCVQSKAAPQPGTVASWSLCSGTAPASSRACGTGACPTFWQQSGLGACTVSCGGGVQTQKVLCMQTQNGAQSQVGEQYCAAPKPVTEQPCNVEPCADGQWRYGTWTKCSKDCGGGVQTRSQSCVDSTGASVDAARCSGSTQQPTQQACNTGVCPSYVWESSAWSACSASCGGGTQTRAATCVDEKDTKSPKTPANNNLCTLTMPATAQSCNTAACPLPPNWQWVADAWGTCSASCGGGLTTRAVRCTNTVDSTVDTTGASCSATAKPATQQTCSQQGCPTYSWSASGFGTCSKACGSGTQTQTVQCKQDGTSTVAADAQCSGAGTKPATQRTCNSQTCQDGQWSYGAWSTCSASCGGGVQTRTQQCVTAAGAPTSDSSVCPGAALTSQPCNTGMCPNWWWVGEWTTCSSDCGPSGFQTRKVYCLAAAAANPYAPNVALADSDCVTSKPADTQPCNSQPCPTWQPSSPWSDCSTRCNPGTQTRTAACVRFDGSVAPASACLKAAAVQTERSCMVVPCGHWHRELWSECSKPCADSVGPGEQTRAVVCRYPHDDPVWFGMETRDDSLCPDVMSGDTGDGEGEPGVANGKPPTKQLCNVDACPSYYWAQQVTSACSASCGGGTQSARVVCVRASSGVEVGDNLCLGQARPSSTLLCNSGQCPSYAWVAGEVSACSAQCGVGVQTRTVQCRNFRPDASIKYPFVDVADEFCLAAAPKPPSTVTCTLPEDICWGAQFASTGVRNGKCDASTGTCVCRAGFGGLGCSARTAPISNVQTSGAEYGVSGVPVGNPLRVTWQSDPLLIPTVSVVLTREGAAGVGWPVGVYLAAGIPNTNSWTWAAVGAGMSPPLEAGAGYRIRVWYTKELQAPAAEAFSVADACSYVSCGLYGSCRAGQCMCRGGWSGDRCQTGPCEAAQCDATHSTCSNDAAVLQAGSATLAVCPCRDGYSGAQCRTPPACAAQSQTCRNGGDMREVQVTADSCTGQCACQGNWTGALCQTCGLQCANGGVPAADCSGCTGCAKGAFGARCEFNYYQLQFQFLSDVSGWYGVAGSAAAASRARFEDAVRHDVLVALQQAAPTAQVDVLVEEVKPVNDGRAKALVTVKLMVKDGESAPSTAAIVYPQRRRLLSAAQLQDVYAAFAPQLIDSTAPLWQGQVTQQVDLSWSVLSSDPSGTQALGTQPAPRDCFAEDCSSAPANGSAGGSKGFLDTLKDSPLYLALAIIGLVVVLALLVVGTLFGVRRCKAASTGNTDLKRLAMDTGAGGTEMVGNPALAAGTSSWNRI